MNNPFKHAIGNTVTLSSEPDSRPTKYTVTAHVTRQGQHGTDYYYGLSHYCPLANRLYTFDIAVCCVRPLEVKTEGKT